MSPYYIMYIVLGFVFNLMTKVFNVLKLDLTMKSIGKYIVGINCNRFKETTPKNSLSQSEIDHMVDMWWNKKNKFTILHTFYQVRIPFIVEALAETGQISKADITKPNALQGVRILDVGCEAGILAEELAQLGAYVVAVDQNREMITLARRHLDTKSPELKNRLEYHATTVEKHAEEFSGTYDAVVCSEVLEHLDEKEPILEACCRCLKTGGSLFVTTENQTLLAWFMFVILPEYILRFAPRHTHCYERFVSPGEVSRIVRKFGCETRRVCGFFYDRIFDKWSFIKDVDCSYGLHAVKK